MTLVVALQGIDGIVMAADSRGTIGDPRGLTAINDFQEKLFQLTKWSGIAVTGSAEIGAQLIDGLTKVIVEESPDGIDNVMTITRSFVRKQYDDWFAKFDVDKRPGMGFLLCGYNNFNSDNPQPKLFFLGSGNDFCPQLFTTGTVLAGVVQYAVYLVHRLYQQGMSAESLCRLAAHLITETATQDPKVGGPIHIATIKPKEGYSLLESDKIKELVATNEEQNERLRQFFFGEGR